MIKLNKSMCPDILVRNGAAWTQVLLDKAAAKIEATQAEKSRYRHPEIKEALINETSGKCAYCESKLLHIHHGDVEHIMPKSLELDKILVWDNLTLACEICNQKKSNRDPNAQNIIDPYVDEPEDHLVFAGPLVVSKGTAKGVSTGTILDLNRGELVERRKEKLEKLAIVIDVILRADLPLPVRQAMWADLSANDSANDSAYTAMAKAFLELMKPHVAPEVLAAA